MRLHFQIFLNEVTNIHKICYDCHATESYPIPVLLYFFLLPWPVGPRPVQRASDSISVTQLTLYRGPLSLVSTPEELLGRKSSGSGLEIREYGCRDPSLWPWGNLYPKKLALTFSDKRRLGWYSSLADSGHGFSIIFEFILTQCANV
jgi:hypothetical protein